MSICTFLDPRSVHNFAMAHRHFSGFVDDKRIWRSISLTNNWTYHNDTFIFLQQFAEKIESVRFDHTGRTATYIVTFAEGGLSRMINLRFLFVSSPYFEYCYFMRHTPKVEVLLFRNCPQFDVDSFVTSVEARPAMMLHTLDLTGVSTVSSLDVWRFTTHMPNLRVLLLQCVMSDFFAQQIFYNCFKLVQFNCNPGPWCLEEWHLLKRNNPQIKCGPHLQARL